MKISSIHIRKFGGIDNKSSVTDITPERATDAQNVDFNIPFALYARKGYTQFNSVAVTGTPSIQSLHRYVGSADTSLLAFCGDGTIRKSQGGNGTFLNSLSGLTTQANTYGNAAQFGGRRVSSTNYAGRLFFVNGVDTNKTYSEADGWQLMGIQPPAVEPTLAVSAYNLGSAAMASGNYYFKMTYYNSAKGLESNPSSISTLVSLTASGGSLTVTLPATADSQVTHKKIYRTPYTGVSTFNLLATVAASATAYFTSAADSLLGAVAEVDNNPPPKFKYIEEFQSCLFGAGDPTDSVSKSLLYYSKQLNSSPESWPVANYLSITPDDGDEITCIRRIGDRLLVAKKNSWGVIVGYDPSSFRYVQMDSAHGIIAPRSAAMTENALVALSNDGFRAFNGVTSELVCKDTMKFDSMSFNTAQLALFYGVYFKRDRQYICAIVTGSDTSPTKCVKIQFPGQEWCFDDYKFICGLQFYDTSYTEYLYVATAAGKAYNMFPSGIYSDNGAAIGWYYTFGPNYQGAIASYKRWHTCVINADNSNTPSISFQESVDGGALSTQKAVALNNPFTRTGMGKVGRYSQIKLSGSSTAYTRINDLEIMASVEQPGRYA